MSKVEINLKNTQRQFDAVRDGVKFDFTYNEQNGSISGGFQKLDTDERVGEHLGGATVNSEGFPSLNLSAQSSTFTADFRICLDLINDAINHIKKLPA